MLAKWFFTPKYILCTPPLPDFDYTTAYNKKQQAGQIAGPACCQFNYN